MGKRRTKKQLREELAAEQARREELRRRWREREPVDFEYAADEIVPIPALCTTCRKAWVDRDAIRAPSLDCCRCGCCGGNRDGRLMPHPDYPLVVDAELRRAMTPYQRELF